MEFSKETKGEQREIKAYVNAKPSLKIDIGSKQLLIINEVGEMYLTPKNSASWTPEGPKARKRFYKGDNIIITGCRFTFQL